MPVSAFAEMTVHLKNKSTKEISLAVRYKDAVADEWVTRGWWNVGGLEEGTFKLNTNNAVIYYYATSGKTYWGGKEGKEGSAQYSIVSGKFTVKGDIVPQGKGLKNVWFIKKTAKDRVFNITLQGE